MSKFIFKICSLLEWEKFKKEKIFFGTKKDLTDGYIHLSKKSQVENTLKTHFFKKSKLVLLKLDTVGLKKLKWEKSEEGLVFPHLYSNIKLKSIKSVYKIELSKNGFYHFYDL